MHVLASLAILTPAGMCCAMMRAMLARGKIARLCTECASAGAFEVLEVAATVAATVAVATAAVPETTLAVAVAVVAMGGAPTTVVVAAGPDS